VLTLEGLERFAVEVRVVTLEGHGYALRAREGWELTLGVLERLALEVANARRPELGGCFARGRGNLTLELMSACWVNVGARMLRSPRRFGTQIARELCPDRVHFDAII
jgi:hypothetical protein